MTRPTADATGRGVAACRDAWHARGLRVPECSVPEQVVRRKTYTQRLTGERSQAARQTVARWLHERVVRRVAHPVYVHPLVVVPKRNGKWRTCLNCRSLNDQISFEHCKLERLADFLPTVKRNSWIATTDLKDAYQQIPVRAVDQWKLAFCVDGQTYVCTGMPFGLSSAPGIFTKCLRPIAGQWRAVGINVLIYLDDIVISADSLEGCQDALNRVRSDLTALGFRINFEKSTEPSTRAQVLGFDIDTETMTISIPNDKRQSIRADIRRTLAAQRLSRRGAKRLLGRLRALSTAVPAVRVCTAELLYMVQRRRTRISEELRRELEWWAHTGMEMVRCWVPATRPKIEIFTDASLGGWGAACPALQLYAHGQWSTPAHINVLEMEAIRIALERWAYRLQGHHVQISTDSITAFHYLRKTGGTKRRLNRITRQVWRVTQQYNIEVGQRFVPGHTNVIADRLSRLKGLNRVRLPEPVWLKVNHWWGPFSADICADSRSARLDCSIRYDLGGDVLRDRLPPGTLYAFPPPRLIPALLERIERERRKVALIVPEWRTAIWWPQLQRLASSYRTTSRRQPSKWCWGACLVDCERHKSSTQSSSHGLRRHSADTSASGANSSRRTGPRTESRHSWRAQHQRRDQQHQQPGQRSLLSKNQSTFASGCTGATQSRSSAARDRRSFCPSTSSSSSLSSFQPRIDSATGEPTFL